jgi:hypothetical protein
MNEMADTEDDVAQDTGIDSRKGAWSADEDEQLRSLVAQYGTTCWSQIAAGMLSTLQVIRGNNNLWAAEAEGLALECTQASLADRARAAGSGGQKSLALFVLPAP